MRDIPIYSTDGRILRTVPDSSLASVPGLYCVRNRRGHIVRAYLSGTAPMRPLSQGVAGACVEQPLSTGHVYALKNERGAII
jgi:hypothetical protein